MDESREQTLREWRDSRGVTRRQLAFALCVTERTIARWEAGQGKPRPGDLELMRRLWPEPDAQAKC